MTDWVLYQDKVAEFFRNLGMQTTVNATVSGSRTSHDIDVLVQGQYAGFDIIWIVECKAWKKRVPKERVLILRQIVNDTGADRGFLLAESGYQTGALEAALLSNVTLTSIAELTERLSYDLAVTKLIKLENRTERLSRQYRSIDKEKRIDAGLRPSIDGGTAFSAVQVIERVNEGLRQVRLRGFPVVLAHDMSSLYIDPPRDSRRDTSKQRTIDGPEDLYKFLDKELTYLERRLNEVTGIE